MFDGFIFDVDGTIWNTTYVVAMAWNDALSELGLKERVDAKRLQGLFGLPMDDIIADILPYSDNDTREAFKKLCYIKEHDYVERENIPLYEGMEETFKGLSEKSEVFIVSNCQSGYIELLLKKTGYGKYVKDFACYGDKGLLKADNIKMIVEKHNLKKTLYIGDTQMDANACREAGVPICYCTYGFGKVENPDFTISRVDELLDFVNN